MISLKAGDTFSGQFVPKGNGHFDTSAFNTTYNSTLTSSQATCVAGSTYSTAHANAIADGASSGTADTIATGLCRQFGIEAALVAAFPAADASGSTSWITLQPYSTGADPIIDAGSTYNAAIDFPNAFTGGWKIKHIKLQHAKAAAIHLDTAASHGVWLDTVVADSIDGMPLPPGGSDNSPRVAGFTNAWPAGLEASNVSELYITNSTLSNTGTPAMIWGSDHTLINATSMNTSKYQSLWLLNYTVSGFITDVAVIGGRITNMGTLGWPNGTADVAMTRADTVIFDGVQIDTAAHADSDAESIDFESTDTRVLINGCNLHDDFGAPLSVTFGGATDALIFVGNTWTNNGTGAPAYKPALFRQTIAPPTYNFWQNNATTRAGSGTTQKLFASVDNGGVAPPATFQDAPYPANVYYGTDNTVTP